MTYRSNLKKITIFQIFFFYKNNFFFFICLKICQMETDILIVHLISF